MTTDTKAPSLLPCPFCNGPADFECIGVGEYTTWSVGCANPAVDCIGFQMMARFSRKCEAAEAWNARATPPAPTPSAAREMELAHAVNNVLNAMVDACEEMTTTRIAARILADKTVRAALLPDAAAIRAAAFEEAAKIATKHAFQARMKVRAAKGPKQRHLALAHEQAALDLAAAIRAAGENAK